MDELELLRRIEAQVQAALKGAVGQPGMSLDDVNAAIAQSGVKANNLQELQQRVIELEGQREDPAFDNAGRQFAAGALQGASFGTATDVLRGLSALPGVPDDIDDRFVESLRRGREDHPGLSVGGQVAGAISPVGVGSALLKGSVAATRGIAGAGRSLFRTLARGAGAGPGVTSAAGAVGSGAGALVGGASTGAADATLFGATESRSRSNPASTAREAFEEGAQYAPGGAIFGGIMGPIGNAVSGTRQAMNQAEIQQSRLSDAAQDISGLPTPTSGRAARDAAVQEQRQAVRGLIDFGEASTMGPAGRRNTLQQSLQSASGLPPTAQARAALGDLGEARRMAFEEALGPGRMVPDDVAQRLMENPAIRQALRATGGDPADYLQAWQAAHNNPRGPAGAVPQMTAKVFDDLRKQVSATARLNVASEVGEGIRTGQGNIARAEQAQKLIDEVMDNIMGLPQANQLSAIENAGRRGLKLGEQLMTNRYDAAQVTEQLARLARTGSGEVGQTGVIAARHGGLKRVMQQLGGTDGNVRAFVRQVSESPEWQSKLKALIGDEGRYNRFMQDVARVADDAELEKVLAKAAGTPDDQFLQQFARIAESTQARLFPDFQLTGRLTALRDGQEVGWAAGKKLLTESGEEGAENLARLGQQQGPEAVEAARISGLQEWLEQMGGTHASVRSEIVKLRQSPAYQRRIQNILGGEANMARFMEHVNEAATELTSASVLREAIKYAGFTLLGSSLAGGAVIKAAGG